MDIWIGVSFILYHNIVDRSVFISIYEFLFVICHLSSVSCIVDHSLETVRMPTYDSLEIPNRTIKVGGRKILTLDGGLHSFYR